jgi:site-specific DNA-methyltransferase (adenine-specific)
MASKQAIDTLVRRIPVCEVVVKDTHRALKPWLLQQITESMRDHGYNDAYPIVITRDGALVEGRHRLESAKAIGIKEVPFIYLPADASPIRFGLLCNADGQKTAADDVFDLAELCWTLAENEGWEGKRIATEVGFGNVVDVTNYKNIKEKLHPKAWELARNRDFAKSAKDTLANPELAIANWRETHFRSFLSHLAYTAGDRAIMRAQVKAVRELLISDKLTAKVAGEVAQRYAWHTLLAKYMNENLVKEVRYKDRKGILRNIRLNVYGKLETPEGAAKFAQTISEMNKKALGVKLYKDDCFQRIPLLADKSLDEVITDPPYNTTDHPWDKIGETYVEWLRDCLRLTRPKLKDLYHAFLFCDPDYAAEIEMMLKQEGWPLKSRIIWTYRNLTMGRDVTDKFIENYQVCFHLGTHALNWGPKWDESRFMVQEFATPQSNFLEGRHHPTAKPVGLIKRLVEVGSKPGDVILDMFAGGGTTGEATSQVGQRSCILIEQDEEFCGVIERRLKIKRQE